MQDWPDLADDALLERLALDDEAFHAYMEGLAVHVPAGRPFDDEVLARPCAVPLDAAHWEPLA